MKVGYTEFSFGFAFTENIIRSRPLAPNRTPYFPNLIQEATLGYDVRLDFDALPVFYQFKLPELLIRRNAREYARLHDQGLNLPYFRMPIMRANQSDQHRLLIDWETAHPGRVHYSSPNFIDPAGFNQAFSNCSVHTESILISPLAMGPIHDTDEHCYVYNRGAMQGWFCSEPLKINHQNGKKGVDDAIAQVTSGGGVPVPDVPEKLIQDLRDVLPRRDRGKLSDIFSAQVKAVADVVGAGEKPSDAGQEIARIVATRNISRIFLGVEMLLVQAAR